MRIRIILGIFLLLVFFSCSKSVTEPVPGIPNGTYKGTFLSTRAGKTYPTANVTITFTGNEFDGDSDLTSYPNICQGTYELTGDQIKFNGACARPDFLSGTFSLAANFKYKIRINGPEITIVNLIDDTQNDTYNLTLQ